ncbi:OLC1v1032586C2 [Oldenlandia corymbosa var. corymbosa]|uniref:OLC1v1032586C2 n=1 Tax=Oldenlandia corymbosa var. corymbosa TaxID=529605 RepID=A0AAV1CN64_OLDCO|nr:OLC1v1032586C2 [Oldenlandia corymbosa var. corymbosa]
MPNAKEQSDGLEIICIGKLYSGPWEKKYWSSSRGKDRYPYPVDFNAVRTQNGITYRIEIFEGPKGPLFTISSTDGLSCSGHTPDIAWESFQKKSCSQIKFLHGKRFSCKIDGMEFFGFKNAFVQRLLRELVANVGANTANSMLQYDVCKDSSHAKDSIKPTEIPQVRGRRSRKQIVTNSTSVGMKDLKRNSLLNGEIDTDASSCKKRCQAKDNDKCSTFFPAQNKDNELTSSERDVVKPAKSETMIDEQERKVSDRDGLQSKSFYAPDHLKNDDCFPEEKSPLSCGKSTRIEEGNYSLKKQDMLDQPTVSAGCQSNGLVTEEENEKRTCLKTVSFSELCVRDTLDDSPVIPEDSIKLKEVGATVFETESESPQENEIGTSISQGFDESELSVGEQITKSMMTVLLPRAIPLLKTFSRRKKKKENVKASEVTIPSTTINMKIGTVPSPAKAFEKDPVWDQNKNTQISHMNRDSCSQIKSVVPDSFDDYDDGSHVNSKPHLPDAAADEQNFVFPETCLSDTVDVEVDKSNISCSTDRSLLKGPQGGYNLVPKPSFGSTFCNEENKFTNSSKNSLCSGKEPEDGNHDHLDLVVPESDSLNQKSNCFDNIHEKKEGEVKSTADSNRNLKHESLLPDLLKLVVCYVHPMPISSVLLRLVRNDIYICVVSGSMSQEDKTLFVYRTPVTGEKSGSPVFVGHASVNIPMSEDAFGNKIAADSSAIQFSPDGQSLVLLNSIKVPCCREGSTNCLCPACSSDHVEKNAIKIVHVKVGYISVVSKLKTAQTVRYILVCEPNYLVATEDSGKLCLWMMNSRWSAHIEGCYLPLPENSPSHLVELKKIPQSPVLIIGHNGFGEFSLWNIEKRILVSRFSAPSMPISKCVPVCLFDWPKKGSFPTEYTQDELLTDVLGATKVRLSGSNVNHLTHPVDNEDGAVWLLISTVPNTEFDDPFESWGAQMNEVGCWRLALLVEGMVVMGRPLDISAAAVGASAGHGVIGRSDGLVYMWELATGMKLGDLHHLKGSGVSCIASDSSNSGLAIASNGGHLLVYINPRRASSEALSANVKYKTT